MILTIICNHCRNKWKMTEWRVVSMKENFKCPRCGKKVEIQITASTNDEKKPVDKALNL